MKSFLKVQDKFWDILFPPLCICCRKYLEGRQTLLCEECLDSVVVYKNVFYKDPFFRLAAVTGYENPAIRELIYYFKYKGFLGARRDLEELLQKYLGALGHLDSDSSIIVPVSLHPKRERKRGYNQANIIADIAGKNLEILVCRDVIVRTRNTKQQITMASDKERANNVRDCFTLKNREVVRGKTVILVDDVYTSGATMHEAVKMLRRAGALEVIGLVVAKA